MVMYNQEKRSHSATWTSHDRWLFLNAVANGPECMIDIIGQWQELANAIPGKTADEVKTYYKAVEHDLLEIEADRVELPNYPNDNIGDESVVEAGTGSKSGKKKRKKATPWSVEEHKRFLQGLEVYGKGDWRSISRMMVVTRTATQVASHAQKYFIRQASIKEDKNKDENKRKKRKRSIIHDITTADASMAVVVQPSSATSPATSLNGGDQGREVPAGPTTLSPHGGQFMGSQDATAAQPTSPTTSLYGGQATTSTSTPLDTSFYESRGNDLYCGEEQPVTSFYGEAVPLWYEFMAAKDYSEEVFNFENISFVSEPIFE